MKHFALTSDLRDFGEGKKVKKKKNISNTFYITVMFPDRGHGPRVTKPP